MARTALLAGGGAAAAVAVAAVVAVTLQSGQSVDQDVDAQEVTSEVSTATVSETPPAPQTEPEPEQEAAPEEETAAAEPEPEQTEAEEPAPLGPPAIDLVRAEPSGQTLIAGQAAPESDIHILIDGAERAETRAGRDGKFAQFLDLDPSDKPQVVTLLMRFDGQEVEGDSSVIIAPTLRVVAEATPEADEPPVEDVVVQAEVEEPVEENEDANEEVASEDVAEAEAAQSSEPAQESPAAVAQAVTDVEAVSTTEQAEAVANAVTSDAEDTVAVASEAVESTNDVVADVAETLSTQATQDAPEPPETDQAEAQEPTQDTPVITATGEDAPEEATEVASAQATQEPQAPTVLKADEEGIRVLQAPEVADAIALDTISYDETGDVALAGRASTGFVRVYLDNKPITTSRIEADGSWRAGLPEVDRGIYTLRVDEVDADGEVTSRVETPFKREDRAALAAADVDASDAPARVVTVQPGNTLWAIARERYGEGPLYVRLFEANKDRIRDPDLIYPGQVFDLPE